MRRAASMLIATALALCCAGPALSQQTPGWRGPVALGDRAPVPTGASSFAVAAGNGVYLVALTRSRELMFTRLDADGRVLDSIPVAITDPGRTVQGVAVAWNGERFLVVWREEWFNVRGAFLLPDGRQDGDSFAVVAASFGDDPLIASNGDSYLVSGGTPEKTVIVSADGFVRPVDDASVPVEAAGVSAVASNGSDYLLAVHMRTDTGASLPMRLLKTTGEQFEVLPFRPELSAAALSWTGEDYVLVGSRESLTGYHIAADGSLLSGPHTLYPEAGRATPLIVSEPNGRTIIAAPASPVLLEWRSGEETSVPFASVNGDIVGLAEGGRTLLFYRSAGVIRHSFVDDDALSRSSPTVHTAADQSPPDIAATPTGWFAVWRERRGNDLHVRAAVLSRSLTTLREIDLDVGQNARTRPSVAVSPENVLVAWASGDDTEIVGQRFTWEGDPIDEEPFAIASAAFQFREHVDAGPGLVWNGRYFLLVVSGQDDTEPYAHHLSAFRITTHGSVLDPEGIELPDSGREASPKHHVAMVATGGRTIVTWEDGTLVLECRFDPCPLFDPSRVEALVLDIEGRPESTQPLVLSEPDRVGTAPAVAARGGEVLVAWRDWDGVRGRFLETDGSITRDFFLAGPAGYYMDQSRVSLAPFGEGFFILWDAEPVSGRRVISGRLVDEGGTVVETLYFSAEVPVVNEAWPYPSVHSRDGQLVILFGRWSRDDGSVRGNYMMSHSVARERRRGVRLP